MSKRTVVTIILVLAAVAAIFLLQSSSPEMPTKVTNGVSHIIAGGKVGFSYPEEVFGLAVTAEQVFARSYIPPCDYSFDYCIYYLGGAYDGTNFESAGLRISRRPDLDSEDICLNSQVEGYTALKSDVYRAPNYSTSRLGPVSNAAAGHYTTGWDYRLFYGNFCYEFETRIGESQFANYPPGAIKEFTAADRTTVETLLREILGNITLVANGQRVVFPK